MEPTTEYEDVDYGLIAPNGGLYETDYEGHCGLADDLYAEGVVESSSRDYFGCVHVADGYFDVIEGDGWYSGQDVKEARRVTQKQFDTMVAYKLARGEKFNFDILEVIDAKPKTKRVRKGADKPFSQVSAAG